MSNRRTSVFQSEFKVSEKQFTGKNSLILEIVFVLIFCLLNPLPFHVLNIPFGLCCCMWKFSRKLVPFPREKHVELPSACLIMLCMTHFQNFIFGEEKISQNDSQAVKWVFDKPQFSCNELDFQKKPSTDV